VIIPCIDLMGGKVVQLVQGREKVLEADDPLTMLQKFAAFRQIQVIDLDAAIGNGENSDLVQLLASKAVCRVGGGVRTVQRASTVLAQGAFRVIVGTAAFTADGINQPFLEQLAESVGPEPVVIALDSKGGRITVKGWRESLQLRAEQIIRSLEPYCRGFLCTYVDKEGMLQGTDLDWFRRLRNATGHEITAAGGISTIEDIRSLEALSIHSALGMAICTGRLNIAELARM
jgi:phosphoribosylformimino-5-aminoimidazole carboxamide ribotide isomerase